ncbi:MAG: hypothetical protein AAB535_03200 [Patescibacteria group bacterium]
MDNAKVNTAINAFLFLGATISVLGLCVAYLNKTPKSKKNRKK